MGCERGDQKYQGNDTIPTWVNIFREMNRLADHLAKEHLVTYWCEVDIGQILPVLQAIILDDASCKLYLRCNSQ